METSPWWFTPVMTFAGAVFGGAVSVLTTWLTQRKALEAQLAVKRAEAAAAAAAAIRAEKMARYLAIVQNIDSLFFNSSNPSGRVDFLKAQREIQLLGDQELVLKLRDFLTSMAARKDVDFPKLFGDVVLEMRKGLNLPTDQLSNQDFPFHTTGQ